MITNEERVFAALLDLGETATGDEISRALGWDKHGGARRVGQAMQSFIDRGRVERLATGIYRAKKRLR